MAAPSGLARLIQMANPIASLSPAGQILSVRDQPSLGRLSADPVDFDEDYSYQQDGHCWQNRSSPLGSSLSPAARVASPAQDVASPELLHLRATGASRRLSYEPSCALASTPDGRSLLSKEAAQHAGFALSGPNAWTRIDGLVSGLLTSGLGYSAESTMLPAQEEALWRIGKRSAIAHLPSSSTRALDAFAADLITSQGLEDAFYTLDIGTLDRLFLTWQAALPRVTPYYAVKCNPSPIIMSALEVLGAGFDCASEAEIDQVLKMGVSPDRIIFANPCKMPSHIKFAAKSGVASTTFDSIAELDKMKTLYPEAQLLLRIQTRDSGARCPLGTKYGALPEEVDGLLAAAALRGLSVTGVSFHVGSGAADSTAYFTAIAAAHDVFKAAAELGHPMAVLDIGGGFTAPRDNPALLGGPTSNMSFFQAAQAINAALDEFFPDDSGVAIIAEPGRYFAETPCTLAARIFGKRVRGGQREYWINDGLYGSMNCTLYDHAVLSARPLRLVSSSNVSKPGKPEAAEDMVSRLHVNAEYENPEVADVARYSSTVFGPTCDGLDVVLKGVDLPNLEMGDWLIFPNMGAYTAAAGSSFNGFATSQLETHIVFSTLDTSCLEGGSYALDSAAETAQVSLRSSGNDFEPVAAAY